MKIQRFWVRDSIPTCFVRPNSADLRRGRNEKTVTADPLDWEKFVSVPSGRIGVWKTLSNSQKPFSSHYAGT